MSALPKDAETFSQAKFRRDAARFLFPRGGDWLVRWIADHGLGANEKRAGRLFDWRLGVQRERAGIELARVLLASDVDPLLVVGIVESVSFRWDAPSLMENLLFAIVDRAAAREAEIREEAS